MYLLDLDATLSRLPPSKFEQMLGDPTRWHLPPFAGSRPRMTDVAVELIDRRRSRAIWITFGSLPFYNDG